MGSWLHKRLLGRHSVKTTYPVSVMGTQALPALKDGHLPFILVNLRIKKEDTEVRTDKTVIRLGSDLEYQSLSRSWANEGIQSFHIGEGEFSVSKARKNIEILSRCGDSHKLIYHIVQESLPDYHLTWKDG
eukprot:TRINITY_DN15555_c0_g1_i1.p1 TRINITY_DN15555_c0_g1~~TRINITY_DN15555_c0_g1_i1.p1  ORF type:complete len:131 (-),score=33.94 TRINITY_DN15555_c0_g1_i1:96-488(-)